MHTIEGFFSTHADWEPGANPFGLRVMVDLIINTTITPVLPMELLRGAESYCLLSARAL
jgi:hypothetical protein